jgi:plastocyanin
VLPGRHGRRVTLLALVGLALIPAAARADDAPAPQLGLGAPQLTDSACTDGSPAGCQRMRFAYGPVTVRPGANMQLIWNDIQKPLYDGYVTRLTANLYRADGTIPPVDVVHLHHGAWLSNPTYGNFPIFFAAGEEKTHMQVPSGYGMKVHGSDVWALAYMLHNLTPVEEHVYITYDLDYTPAEQAEANGIKPAIPLWLDVQNRALPFYPVFNVQRGFGHYDKKFARKVCVFPKERCAAFNPFGEAQPGNGVGWDWTVPANYDGTVIAMGGHVHPGGLEDQVSLVRGKKVKRVFNSDAKYWDKAGPVSWDMAMTVTPPDWRLRIHAGDKIRLNAVYDSQQASWYENMGIVMAFVAPGDTSGVDVFDQTAAHAHLATTGDVTHGHLAENDHHGGTGGRALPTTLGPVTNRINITNYAYRPGDLSAPGGIPRVRATKKLTFFNADDKDLVWHTVTTCAAPCTAETGIAYPLANAMPALDSLEIGLGFPNLGLYRKAEPASGKVTFSLTPSKAGLRAGQTYTYFCRIHPFMRGAFKVVR